MGTIAEEISSLRDRINVAYEHIQAKGGIVPALMNSWNLSDAIDSIPSEAQNVNGVPSLYSYLPEMKVWPGRTVATLSGTTRENRQYAADYSVMTQINNWQNGLGCFFSRYSIQDVDIPTAVSSNMVIYKSMMPQVSSIDLHNLTAVNANYSLAQLVGCNPNVLSVNLDNLQYVRNSNYQFFRAFQGTAVPCDLPSLREVRGSYSMTRCWEYVSADAGPQQERFLPELTGIIGSSYAFSYAWYGYRPKENGTKHLNLSALKELSSSPFAFQNALADGNDNTIRTKFTDFTCGAYSIVSPTAQNGYEFQYFAYNNKALTGVFFPNLSAIGTPTAKKNLSFQYAFYNCQTLSSLEFPKLEYIKGDNVFQYAFRDCDGLSRLSFPKLREITTDSQNVFNNFFVGSRQRQNRDVALSIFFPELTTFRENGSGGLFFNGSPNGQIYYRPWKVYMNGVKDMVGSTTAANSLFSGSNFGLTDVYFKSLSSITNTYLFQECPQLSGIHFGAENEDAIRATTGFATLWGRGAGNATVSFEL